MSWPSTDWVACLLFRRQLTLPVNADQSSRAKAAPQVDLTIGRPKYNMHGVTALLEEDRWYQVNGRISFLLQVPQQSGWWQSPQANRLRGGREASALLRNTGWAVSCLISSMNAYTLGGLVSFRHYTFCSKKRWKFYPPHVPKRQFAVESARAAAESGPARKSRAIIAVRASGIIK